AHERQPALYALLVEQLHRLRKLLRLDTACRHCRFLSSRQRSHRAVAYHRAISLRPVYAAHTTGWGTALRRDDSGREDEHSVSLGARVVAGATRFYGYFCWWS